MENVCEVKHCPTDCGCRAVKNSEHLTYDYEVGLNFFSVCLGQQRNTPPKPWVWKTLWQKCQMESCDSPLGDTYADLRPRWQLHRGEEEAASTWPRPRFSGPAIKSKCALVASVNGPENKVSQRWRRSHNVTRAIRHSACQHGRLGKRPEGRFTSPDVCFS